MQQIIQMSERGFCLTLQPRNSRGKIPGQPEHLIHINRKPTFMTSSAVVLLHELALGISLLFVSVEPPVDCTDIGDGRHSKFADESSSESIVVLPGIGRS
jgi:hypothetical protein